MTAAQAEAILSQARTLWLELRGLGGEPTVIRAAPDVYEAFEMHYDAFANGNTPQFAGVVFRTAAVLCEPTMKRGTMVIQ